jgi:hypothetical protein
VWRWWAAATRLCWFVGDHVKYPTLTVPSFSPLLHLSLLHPSPPQKKAAPKKKATKKKTATKKKKATKKKAAPKKKAATKKKKATKKKGSKKK